MEIRTVKIPERVKKLIDLQKTRIAEGKTRLIQDILDDRMGIFNKYTFFRSARVLLDRAEKEKKYVLIRGDIDRFKVFNELYGTEQGDRVLRHLGDAIRILAKEMGQDTLYGRLEDDHFAILAERSSVKPSHMVTYLKNSLRKAFPGFSFNICLGLYPIDDPQCEVSVMCDRSLITQKTVKGRWGKSYAWYNEELRKKLLWEEQVTNDMTGALRRDEYELYMQPQYNYATGKMVGVEALARWNHPKLGMIIPSDFIPLFEKNGFISLLDARMRRKVCEWLRKQLDEGNAPVPVSVNIGRVELFNGNLLRQLTHLLEKYRIPTSLICIEITEGAYMERPEQMRLTVQQLRDAGFQIHMDDFGSNYSSLNCLRDMPVDVIKLDLRFLTGHDDPKGGNILNAVVSMARWLDIPVIAEGVETVRQAEFLKNIGCLNMQGHYFSRAIPLEAFEKLPRELGDAYRERSSTLQAAEQGFFNSDSALSLVFNRYVGGAALCEYDGEHLEGMMVNDRFYDESGITRDIHERFRKDLLARLTENDRIKMKAALNGAVENAVEYSCEHGLLDADGRLTEDRFYTRILLITRREKSHLVYLCTENTTRREHNGSL